MCRAMSLASFLPLVVAGFVIYATWFDMIVTVVVGIVGFIGFLMFLGIANICCLLTVKASHLKPELDRRFCSIRTIHQLIQGQFIEIQN